MSVARCHRSYGETLHITGPRDGDTAASDPDAAVRRSLAVLFEPLSLRAGGTDTCDSVDDDTIVSVYL